MAICVRISGGRSRKLVAVRLEAESDDPSAIGRLGERGAGDCWIIVSWGRDSDELISTEREWEKGVGGAEEEVRGGD